MAILPRCCPRRWMFFCVVAHYEEKCSTLLPTTPIIFLVVGNNAENCSNLISIMFFRVVARNADTFCTLWTIVWKNDLRCCLHCGKMATQKNGRIQISPRIRNHMRIYTRISIRWLGWCASWRKVKMKKMSWGCPFSGGWKFVLSIGEINSLSSFDTHKET